jgi:Mn-dependent DtxR family transcriptional regulator
MRRCYDRKQLKKVFQCYETFINKHGYSPSYDQVQEETGISRGYVSGIVNELIMLGYLEKPRDRIIKLTGMEWK